MSTESRKGDTPIPQPTPEDPAVGIREEMQKLVSIIESSATNSQEREAALTAIGELEERLIATRATTPLGVVGKLGELVEHLGWNSGETCYESRLCRSAVKDLERMGSMAKPILGNDGARG